MSKTRYACRGCGYVEVEDMEAHMKSKSHMERDKETQNTVFF